MVEYIKELNDANFSNKISAGNWAVDFWAAWCGPCRQMAPHFDAAAEELKNINFGKINVESNSKTTQQNNILGIPCIIFFKNGKEVGRSVGLVEKDEILERAKKAFE